MEILIFGAVALLLGVVAFGAQAVLETVLEAIGQFVAEIVCDIWREMVALLFQMSRYQLIYIIIFIASGGFVGHLSLSVYPDIFPENDALMVVALTVAPILFGFIALFASSAVRRRLSFRRAKYIYLVTFLTVLSVMISRLAFG